MCITNVDYIAVDSHICLRCKMFKILLTITVVFVMKFTYIVSIIKLVMKITSQKKDNLNLKYTDIQSITCVTIVVKTLLHYYSLQNNTPTSSEIFPNEYLKKGQSYILQG